MFIDTKVTKVIVARFLAKVIVPKIAFHINFPHFQVDQIPDNFDDILRSQRPLLQRQIEHHTLTRRNDRADAEVPSAGGCNA